MSKLYFSYAAMNAGKSTILLQASWNYQERGMNTLLFTSALYAKSDDGRITSRIGIAAEAELYGVDDDLYARIARAQRKSKIDCIFVDEAQFLTPDQVWQLARVADRLAIPVMCFGLRTDFQGKLFPGSAELLAIADNLREIRTICHCGRKATMVVRQAADGRALTSGEQIGIEKTMYVSLCRGHWEEETGRWPLARSRSKAVAVKPEHAAKKQTVAAAKRTRPALKQAAARAAPPARRSAPRKPR